METKRYVMVKNGVVYNTCIWDGDLNTWTPPNDSTILIVSENAGIGDRYNAKEKRFYRPIPPDESN